MSRWSNGTIRSRTVSAPAYLCLRVKHVPSSMLTVHGDTDDTIKLAASAARSPHLAHFCTAGSVFPTSTLPVKPAGHFGNQQQSNDPLALKNSKWPKSSWKDFQQLWESRLLCLNRHRWKQQEVALNRRNMLNVWGGNQLQSERLFLELHRVQFVAVSSLNSESN